MFLVSGPDLVVEACNAGVIGTFPSLNQRTTEGYRDWLQEIKGRLSPDAAAFGVNHIVHPTNPRLMADMMVSVEEKVPLIITSLGAVRDVVEAVHGYGGVVFHDIANVRHARKAASRRLPMACSSGRFDAASALTVAAISSKTNFAVSPWSRISLRKIRSLAWMPVVPS